MQGSTLDEMTDQAIAVLATGDNAKIKSLVRDLAMAWPNEPALSVSFALTSAAASLTDLVKGQTSVSATAYQLAALVAADVLAIEQAQKSRAEARHLLHFWRRVDPYFLDI